MRAHRQLIGALLAAAPLVAAGCTSVYTIDDVVTESAAVRDDRLLGEWRKVDGEDRARVRRGPGNDYLVVYDDGKDTAAFRVRVGRLGETSVLDAYPDVPDWVPGNSGGVPSHVPFVIEFSGDSVSLRGIRSDSVRKLFRRGDLRVPHSEVGGGDLLLHGDPAGMRSALATIVRQPRMLESAVWYRRWP